MVKKRYIIVSSEKRQPVEMVPEGFNCMRKILQEHKLENDKLN
jgi:hypothetical protein